MTSSHAHGEHWTFRASRTLLYLTVAASIAMFGGSFEFTDLIKQAIVFVGSSAALVLWLWGCVSTRSLRVYGHVIGWVLLGGLVASFISACVGTSAHQGLLGYAGQEAFSWVSFFSCVSLGFLAAQEVSSLTRVYNLLASVMVGGAVLVLSGLLSAWFGSGWTGAGSLYGLATMGSALCVLGLGILMHGTRDESCVFSPYHVLSLPMNAAAWITVVSSLLALVYVWEPVPWIVLIVGLATLFVSTLLRARTSVSSAWITFSGILLALSLAGVFIPRFFSFSLPTEVALSHTASWDIAWSAFKAHPVFGTGPGSWVVNHALYKNVWVNQSPYWNVRFDRGASMASTLFGTNGGVVALLCGVFLACLIGLGVRQVYRESTTLWFSLTAVFSTVLALSVSMALYGFHLAHWVLFWTAGGLLFGMVSDTEWSMTLRQGGALALLRMKAIGSTVLLALAGIFLLNASVAEARFLRTRQAITAGMMTLDEGIAVLEDVAQGALWSDVYARALSEAYGVRIARALNASGAIANPTQLQTDARAVVDTALRATTRQSAHPDNWMALGAAYKGIAPFTDEASEAAVKAYQEAKKREPASPLPPFEAGQALLEEAERLRPLRETTAAQGRAADAYDQQIKELSARAEALLQAAVALKPDEPTFRYSLAIAQERLGKTAQAIEELTRVLQLPNGATPMRITDLAVLLLRTGDATTATQLLEQAVQQDPNLPQARWYLADVYEKAGRRADAIVQLREVKRILPTNEAIAERLKKLQP